MHAPPWLYRGGMRGRPWRMADWLRASCYIHIYIYVYIYICICLCIHMPTYTYTYIYNPSSRNAPSLTGWEPKRSLGGRRACFVPYAVYIHIYVCIFVYVNIYIYTYTYTHIYNLSSHNAHFFDSQGENQREALADGGLASCLMLLQTHEAGAQVAALNLMVNLIDTNPMAQVKYLYIYICYIYIYIYIYIYTHICIYVYIYVYIYIYVYTHIFIYIQWI